MAPEVIENKHYTLKADVYSFGIIIWEVSTRRTPYENLSPHQISLNVVTKNMRPDRNLIPFDIPNGLKELMEYCWDPNPADRPNFDQISKFLNKINQLLSC